jgi:hypothetical protein
LVAPSHRPLQVALPAFLGVDDHHLSFGLQKKGTTGFEHENLILIPLD